MNLFQTLLPIIAKPESSLHFNFFAADAEKPSRTTERIKEQMVNFPTLEWTCHRAIYVRQD